MLTARVSEWQPATFSGVSTQFVIVLLATVAAIGFAYGRGYRPPLMMVAITCTLAAAGAHAVRYQVWFAFAATILVADVMNATSPADDSPAASPDHRPRRSRTRGHRRRGRHRSSSRPPRAPVSSSSLRPGR